MAEQPSPPLAKFLASTDKKTRDKAVNSLAQFLSDSSHDVLPPAEMVRLWKGIFYCFWMSDKPLVQQALASELADLLLLISSPSSSLAFLKGFWEAMVREWNGIDRLRMDKYYMLIRRFVNASFRLLIRSNWEGIQEYNSILTDQGGPLCVGDVRVPSSLTYHLCDIYLEELNKALSQDSEKIPPAPLLPLMNPFFVLAARANSTVTHSRVSSVVLEPLLAALSPNPPELSPLRKELGFVDESFPHIRAHACLSEPNSENGSLPVEEVRKGLLNVLLEVGSMPEARAGNRKKIQALWKSAMAEEANGAPSGQVEPDGR